jgi:hypothetical protein
LAVDFCLGRNFIKLQGNRLARGVVRTTMAGCVGQTGGYRRETIYRTWIDSQYMEEASQAGFARALGRGSSCG